MVIKRLHLKVNGEDRDVQIRFNLRDWSSMDVVKRAGIKHTTWLVEYDRSNECVNVDMFAPTWYIDLACIHEMICMGRFYEELVPDLQEDVHRCEKIEKFVLTLAGEHREDYIRARRTMFNEILGKKAYLPQLHDCMLHTLVMLEQQGVPLSEK